MLLISTGSVSHMGHYDYKSNSFSFFNNLVWCYSKIVCTKLEFFAFPRWWESSLLVLLLMTVCHQLLLVIWEMLLLIPIKRKYNFLLIVYCLFHFVADNMFKKITCLFTILTAKPWLKQVCCWKWNMGWYDWIVCGVWLVEDAQSSILWKRFV